MKNELARPGTAPLKPYQIFAVMKKEFTYYMGGICKSKAGSVLVSCVHDLPLDLSEPLIFFSRQTLYKEQDLIS